MRYVFTIIEIHLSIFLFGISSAEDIPQKIVDEYNCYWECCSGKEIVALESAEIKDKPSINSKTIHTISQGEIINCYEGRLHKTPVKFNVKKPFDRYLPRDVIWIVGYLEEGIWEAVDNGMLIEVDLGFDPDSEHTGRRCELSNLCVGVLDKEPTSELWLKLQTKEGLIGWAKGSHQFEKK